MTILRKNEGFSLPEVLTVVAIIGIMSAIAIPSMLSWLSNKGMQSAARDLYSNMKKAQSFAVKENRNCAVTFNGTAGYTVYMDAATPWDASAATNKNFVHDAGAGERIIAQVLWSDYRNVELDTANPPSFADNSGGNPTIAFQPNLIPVIPPKTPVKFLASDETVRLKNSNGRTATLTVSISGNISLK
jgi:prepilin-type N-terminal cleavage/methylation domain-containing protein